MTRPLNNLRSLRVCTWAVSGLFLAYLFLGVAMLCFPTQKMYKYGIIGEVIITLVAVTCVAASVWYLRSPSYHQLNGAERYQRPQAYIIISSLLAMTLGLVLHPVRWHGGLITDALELRRWPRR